MECFYSLSLPGDATFDVDALSKQLSSDPAVLRDPYSSEVVFILCTSPESASRLKAELTANPERACDTRGVITLKPDSIWVSQNCNRVIMDKIAQFVLPLLKEKNCGIGNEYGHEITDRYRGQFEKLFHE
jgi:hypothetical protein